MKRRIDIFIIVTIAVVAGCGGQSKQRPWNTLSECEQENTKISLQNQHLEIKNEQLKKMLETLMELPVDARLETINTLDTIRIAKRTGFYDKDDDGTLDTLIVYLKPNDTAQDAIKAPGQVKIELWDLAAAPDKVKPAQWIVQPADLHTAWGGTIFDSYYRIKRALEEIAIEKKEYTVKVTFTDYVTGKVLTDQTVIGPQ